MAKRLFSIFFTNIEKEWILFLLKNKNNIQPKLFIWEMCFFNE